jgi:hypothetical protein
MLARSLRSPLALRTTWTWSDFMGPDHIDDTLGVVIREKMSPPDPERILGFVDPSLSF